MAYVMGKNPTAAAEALRAILEGPGIKDVQARSVLTMELASVYSNNARHADTVALLEQTITTLAPELPAADRIKLVLTLSDACLQTNDPQKAMKALRDGISGIGAAVPDAVLILNSQLGDVCLRHAKNTAEAEKAYRAAIDNGLLKQGGFDAVSGDRLISAYVGLADVYLETKKQEDAVLLLLGALPYCARYTTGSGRITQKLADIKVSREQMQKTVTDLRQLVAKSKSEDVAAGQAQQVVIRLLLSMPEGRQEALEEAKTYFYWCRDADLETAANLIVEAFKAADLHLSRVNRFLRYQRFGQAGEDGKPGTEDDLADVLKEIHSGQNPDRTAVYEGAIRKISNDWQGLQRQSWLYVCLGQPDKALDALVQSFAACPPDQRMLQQAADALTAFVMRFTKDKSLAENAMFFMMYGPEGKDGKKGTEDDLAEPWEVIRKKIAEPRAPPAGTKDGGEKAAPDRT